MLKVKIGTPDRVTGVYSFRYETMTVAEYNEFLSNIEGSLLDIQVTEI